MRRAVWLMLTLAGPLSSCRNPTQITLLVTTDEPCANVRSTSISVGGVTLV